jgi:acetolactate synthase-1/2/3 large subunit
MRKAACTPTGCWQPCNPTCKPDAVLVADGGDFLSFARVGLQASTYLDPGSLGCIGVGTAFGIAASLACPGRQVVVATGDGAFGFNAMEIDTAVRHQRTRADRGGEQRRLADRGQRPARPLRHRVGTRLQFADHAAMARAFGMHAQRVEKIEDLDAAITTALQNLPALLDVVVSTEARSSDGKSGLAWVPDLQAVAAWDDAERTWRDSAPSPAA